MLVKMSQYITFPQCTMTHNTGAIRHDTNTGAIKRDTRHMCYKTRHKHRCYKI